MLIFEAASGLNPDDRNGRFEVGGLELGGLRVELNVNPRFMTRSTSSTFHDQACQGHQDQTSSALTVYVYVINAQTQRSMLDTCCIQSSVVVLGESVDPEIANR